MIILFGLAGSGKSTQGKILAEGRGGEWLSVGEVLRADGRFDEILKAGELVEDDQVIQLMNEKIEEVQGAGKSIVLDGFPRDEYQAAWFGENLADKTEVAIVMRVPKEELIRRMGERRRNDDTEEAILRRFKIVEENLGAILEILKGKGVRIEEVDGVGTVEEVNERLEKAVRG